MSQPKDSQEQNGAPTEMVEARAVLIQISGQSAGSRYPLDSPVKIMGRSSSVELMLEDPGISRHHAMISMHHDHLELEDMDSSNGTFVNGERILERHKLEDGDLIGVGSVELLVLVRDMETMRFGRCTHSRGMGDPLTGLASRDTALKWLAEEVRFCLTYDRELSLILLDFDHIEDQMAALGKEGVGQVLKEGARRIKDLLKDKGMAGRIGPHVYMVMLPAVQIEVANRFAETLRKDFEAKTIPIKKGDSVIDHKQLVTQGLVNLGNRHVTPDSILNAAEERLKLAIKHGGNRIAM